jgi:hypothetical protein
MVAYSYGAANSKALSIESISESKGASIFPVATSLEVIRFLTRKISV